MEDRPRISFNMVIQDEEEMIGQALGFVLKLASYVDGECEFIIVDGGSSDNTLKIVDSMSDDRFKVYRNPWPGFAKQLNFAISKSNGEWIFPCSGDIVMSDGIYGIINDLIEVDKSIRSYTFPQINLIGDKEHVVDFTDWIINLRRNDPSFSWKGKGLENLCYGNVVMQQHPAHFNFSWQRRVRNVFLVHYANLKSLGSKIRKYYKYTKVPNCSWTGKTYEQVVEIFSGADSLEAKSGAMGKAVLIKDRHKGLTFYGQ